MMRKKFAGLGALALCAVMVVSMAGCGKKNDGNNSAGQNSSQMEALTNPDFVYVPQFEELEEGTSYYDMSFLGDKAYYSKYGWNEDTQESRNTICIYSLSDKTVTDFTVKAPNDGYVNSIAADKDGNVYALFSIWNWNEATQESSAQYFLGKYTSGGEEVYYNDCTDAFQRFSINYVNGFAVDEKGRVAFICDNSIIITDENCKNPAVVELAGNDTWLQAFGTDKSGRVFVAYVSYGTNGSESRLAEVDFDAKALGKTYEHFNNGNGQRLSPSGEGKFLVNDNLSVYEYDCSTQTQTHLFNWLDSDMNGQYVYGMSMLEDGRIAVSYADYENEDSGLVLLTKTNSADVVQKEKIVVASLYGNSSLQSAAIKFNKSNDKYQIVVKSYISNNADWTDTTYSDALTAMNNDIISGNGPDVLDISGLEAEKLAAKGVFADMGACLDKSTVLNREDYFPAILEAYTYDGVLIGIPRTFSLQTVVGSKADLGDKSGWTLSEMVQYGKAHPEAQLFDGMVKYTALYYCMMNNENSFVNWSTGQCDFANPEFESILEFVNSYPDDYNYDSVSEGTKVERGEVLLVNAGIYDFQEIQLYNYMFQNNAVFIGYPTIDGENGHCMYADTVYAITSSCRNKDGAWAFIENYLNTYSADGYDWGLPSNIKQFDAAAANATKIEYVLDEDGNIMYDENGEPYTYGSGGGMSYEDGWSYTYHTPTEAEVDQLRELIAHARPAVTQNDDIMSIITEEAEPFFKGQKSASAVASVIQSRVQTYVDENR